MRTAALVFTMAACFVLGSLPGYAAGNNARVALDAAIEAAKKWQADAVLTSVYTPSADIDGKSAAWSYGFHSAKAGNYLNVTARGRSIETLEVGVGQNDAVATDFMDSDLVIAEAAKTGVPVENVRMRLTKTEWLVNTGDQKGAVTLWLHPRTGKLIKRQTVQ